MFITTMMIDRIEVVQDKEQPIDESLLYPQAGNERFTKVFGRLTLFLAEGHSLQPGFTMDKVMDERAQYLPSSLLDCKFQGRYTKALEELAGAGKPTNTARYFEEALQGTIGDSTLELVHLASARIPLFNIPYQIFGIITEKSLPALKIPRHKTE